MNRALLALPCALLAVLTAPAEAQEARASEAQEARAPGSRSAAPIRRIVVSGARSVPEAAVAQAAARVVGQAGDAAAVRAAADAVAAEYQRRGFPVAQVVATDLAPDGTLTLTVAEGVVRRIVVVGNRKTRAATVRAALETRPGAVYQTDRLAADRDRLARLGIFEDVVIAPDLQDAPPGTPEDQVGQVDVVVRVKERRTGNVSAALGFGDRNGLFGYIDLSEQNLAGTAQRVSAQWQRWAQTRVEDDGSLTEEEARSAFRISYLAPLLARGRLAFGVDVYDKNTIFQPLFAGDDESLRSYERRRGATVRVGRALRRGLFVFLTGRSDEVGYDPIPFRLDPPLAELARADGRVNALGVEATLDGRDAAENPRRGFLWTARYETAGGDFSFGQATLDARQYLPLTGGTRGPVLALRALGGASTGTVPLPEQFWIGGYDLLRGYDLYSVRGDRLLLTSAELRLPLGEGLQAALFVDYGHAWEPDRRLSLADMQAGIGVGLRFLTPIGPIRLDAAYGDGLKTYISLGQVY